ncbi:hypothetical protein [Streptomyces cahuitamycinicus]|uniref:hypothetical protein n=1 Tax=Streptomyces cahuitamycinicus TaxID=2070367 RepID=UPI001FEBE515|nr:hypothetical protein [Streptomyces cahuitamycinicus]
MPPLRPQSALGITALLAVPACSTDTTGSKHQTPSSRTGKPAALSSAALESRLLDPSDLGSGYLPKPARPAQHDDVTVISCPALSELGGDAATGGTLAFPHKAKADLTYGGSSSLATSRIRLSRIPLCMRFAGDRLWSCRQVGNRGERLSPQLSRPGQALIETAPSPSLGRAAIPLQLLDADVMQRAEARQLVG